MDTNDESRKVLNEEAEEVNVSVEGADEGALDGDRADDITIVDNDGSKREEELRLEVEVLREMLQAETVETVGEEDIQVEAFSYYADIGIVFTVYIIFPIVFVFKLIKPIVNMIRMMV